MPQKISVNEVLRDDGLRVHARTHHPHTNLVWFWPFHDMLRQKFSLWSCQRVTSPKLQSGMFISHVLSFGFICQGFEISVSVSTPTQRRWMEFDFVVLTRQRNGKKNKRWLFWLIHRKQFSVFTELTPKESSSKCFSEKKNQQQLQNIY